MKGDREEEDPEGPARQLEPHCAGSRTRRERTKYRSDFFACALPRGGVEFKHCFVGAFRTPSSPLQQKPELEDPYHFERSSTNTTLLKTTSSQRISQWAWKRSFWDSRGNAAGAT